METIGFIVNIPTNSWNYSKIGKFPINFLTNFLTLVVLKIEQHVNLTLFSINPLLCRNIEQRMSEIYTFIFKDSILYI